MQRTRRSAGDCLGSRRQLQGFGSLECKVLQDGESGHDRQQGWASKSQFLGGRCSLCMEYLAAVHKGVSGQATEPRMSTAQGCWCHMGWCLWCSEHGECRWWGWGSQTEKKHPLPFCPPESLMPGQILTRSLGRRASPGPFLLPSGAGTPAYRRGSGPGGRQSAWARQGCMAGARAPCLTGPSLPCR